MAASGAKLKLAERYHPERFRLSRPYARQITALYRASAGITTLPPLKTLEAATGLIVETYNKELEFLPFEQRPADLKRVMKDCSLAMHYASFCCHGRQIFHFNREITEQFRQTDIDQIQISALSFPYDMFYMSFGRQDDLDLYGNTACVDGVYVSVLPGKGLQVLLSTVRDTVNHNNDGRFDWILTEDSYYYLSLPMDDLSQTISHIADKALHKDLSEGKEALEQEPHYVESSGMLIKSKRPESRKVELAELGKGYPAFQEALRLIVNGLCYLSAYPDDVDFRWQEDTPESMLEKIQDARRYKEVQRTVSKLTSMGYTKIHYCGKAFELNSKQTGTMGREMPAHWRRGHWRNQPYGSGLSNRKLIWIMPVIVRKDRQDGQHELGHVYLVDQ